MPILISAIGVAAACFLWGLIEAKLYRTREHTLAVLPPGSPSIRVLQVSDLHLRLSNKRLAAFLTSLANERYDVVIASGDLLGNESSIQLCAELLNRLRGDRKYLVLGSSDYYAPKFKNYIDYLVKRRTHSTKRIPTARFLDLLAAAGWKDMTNRNIIDQWGPIPTQVTGLDDAHLYREDRSLLKRQERMALSICLSHDPGVYQAVIGAGYDLMISGHTHGGQVRLPLVGAIVTNSEVPRKFARWISKVGHTFMFVSPGLGTGKYAPFRFLCPPEASILRLEAIST